MSYSRCLSLSALLASTFIMPTAAMDLTSALLNGFPTPTHTYTPVPNRPIRLLLFVFWGMVTAITESPTAREMKRIIWIRLTSVKMRALSVLVLPVIVWTGPARTMPLTVNVLRKTALLILLQHVQVLSLAKQPVAETVNNVAPIPVPAVQNPIPVPMPRQLNAEPSVIIAIPAVLQEAHLIPVRWLDITNAAQPADPVQQHVPPGV